MSTGLESQIKALEERHEAGETTFFVIYMDDDDAGRKLEEVRAKAGPEDVIFQVVYDD